MPTYQYVCTECGRDLEAVQRFTDDALTECPTCSGRLRKKYGSVGVVFKGSGFYRNDSRSADTSSTPAATGNEKSSEKSDAKPAAAEKSDSSKSESSSKPAAKESSGSSSSGSGSSSSSSGSGSAQQLRRLSDDVRPGSFARRLVRPGGGAPGVGLAAAVRRGAARRPHAVVGPRLVPDALPRSLCPCVDVGPRRLGGRTGRTAGRRRCCVRTAVSNGAGAACS